MATGGDHDMASETPTIIGQALQQMCTRKRGHLMEFNLDKLSLDWPRDSGLRSPRVLKQTPYEHWTMAEMSHFAKCAGANLPVLHVAAEATQSHLETLRASGVATGILAAILLDLAALTYEDQIAMAKSIQIAANDARLNQLVAL